MKPNNLILFYLIRTEEAEEELSPAPRALHIDPTNGYVEELPLRVVGGRRGAPACRDGAQEGGETNR